MIPATGCRQTRDRSARPARTRPDASRGSRTGRSDSRRCPGLRDVAGLERVVDDLFQQVERGGVGRVLAGRIAERNFQTFANGFVTRLRGFSANSAEEAVADGGVDCIHTRRLWRSQPFQAVMFDFLVLRRRAVETCFSRRPPLRLGGGCFGTRMFLANRLAST